MSVATITSKGQVTIPKDVRTRLHLETGEKISFSVDEENGSAVMVPMNKTVDEVFGMLRQPGRAGVKSIEAMDRAVAAKMRREYQ
jgi:AbrB family looped-hinge helix DNA binding protein